MKKIVLITNIPTPYRVPLFNELHAALHVRGAELHVVFGGESYARRQFKVDRDSYRFSHSFLKSKTVQRGDVEKTSFLFNGLQRELSRLKPDAVIVAGFSFATFKVYTWSLFRRVPFYIWNGGVEHPFRPESGLKRTLRRWLVARAAGCIAYGSKAREYLIRLGAKPETVQIGLNTVDTGFFSRETEKVRRSVVAHPEKKHLLTIGYLSARKNMMQLLRIMKSLTALRQDVVLDIVGDGDQRKELERFVSENALTDSVVFHGYQQREQLPPLMAASSLFLFQTDFDIWGLVLNEAMAAGLPVICSPHAGAAHDLIREGETGFIRDFSDPDAMARLIHELLDDPERLERIGASAAGYISRFATLEQSATGFLKALGFR